MLGACPVLSRAAAWVTKTQTCTWVQSAWRTVPISAFVTSYSPCQAGGAGLGQQLLTEVGFVLCRNGVIKLNIYFQEYNYRTISESAATTVRHGRGRQGWGPWGQCHIPQAAALHSGCHQCNG